MDARKIDWINHLIAFGASVIGIFIAFQLDDWQERRARQAQVAIAMTSIKAEIESNLEIYYQTDTALTALLQYTDFYFAHLDHGALLCSEREIETARRENPRRLHNAKFLTKASDTLNRYEAALAIDVAPYSGITTGNWEVARSAGVLNYLDHSQVVLLSQVYEWTSKKIGASEDELLINLVGPGPGDLDQILSEYRRIANVSRLKHKMMKNYYDQIKW